uniref:BPTI/Kunitz inhibitor domain-containing protein n=1 Tax=Meloidogyne incognita TaxID=6306 RepID=A0A914KSL0_MELIC
MLFNFNKFIFKLFLIYLFSNCLCHQHQHYFNNYQNNLSNPFLYAQQQPTVYLTFGNHPLVFPYPQTSNNQQRLSNSYPCISRCQPYRWTTYRWNGAISSNRPQQPNTSSPPPPPPTTTIPPEPSPIVIQLNNTIQPIQSANIQSALIRLIFHSTTIQTTTNSITTSSVVSELPTPPPYTQNVPGDVVSSFHRPNPCPEGQPLINGLHNPMTCNFVVKPNGGCPNNYWCHTGASYETTTCCPYNDHSKSRCQIPRAGGTGDELIPRWYFDAGAHKCKRFLYRGMHGNANNFVTAMSCSETCENTDYLASATRNPCSNGWPARDLAGKQFLCGTSDSRCPAGYFCHLGELATLNVCCELSTAASNRCNLALRIGEGIANLKRFYFNTLTRKCTEFVYKGIKGNENSFLTIDECKAICEKLPNPCPMHYDLGERKECTGTDGQSCGRGEWCHIGSKIETTACCPAAVVDICKLPLDLGQGIENLTRWYAVNLEDPCMRECRPFQYRGMKGNQNNFLTKTECEARCKSECPISLNPCSENGQILLNKEGKPHRCNSTKSGQCPPNYWCHIGANVETTVCCSSGVGKACNQSLAEGFGNALLSRWYYNFKEGNCQKFIYRGIGGNRNNYVDYDDCMNACPDNSKEEEKEKTLTTTTTPLLTTTKTLTTTTLKTKGIRKIKIIPPSPPPPPKQQQLIIKEINLIENPCSNGSKPLLNPNNLLPFECSPEQRCPDTHFCHISDIKYLSQKCCPKSKFLFEKFGLFLFQ